MENNEQFSEPVERGQISQPIENALEDNIEVENLLDTQGKLNVYGNVFPRYEHSEQEPKEPKGIGGWLILVAIGRIIAPILLLFTIWRIYLPYFRDGLLLELSNPDNQAYSSLWRPIILFEVSINAIMLIVGVILLYLFFSKKRSFPKAFIGFCIFTILITIVDGILVYKLQKEITNEYIFTGFSDVFKAVVNSAVWIPYMLLSKRVKNTFDR